MSFESKTDNERSLFARATALFGDQELAKEWFDTPIPALGGVTPQQKIQTKAGRAALKNLLDAIESGEFI